MASDRNCTANSVHPVYLCTRRIRCPGFWLIPGYQNVKTNPLRIIDPQVDEDNIVLTQRLGCASESGWINESEGPGFVGANNLRILRQYQLRAAVETYRPPQIHHLPMMYVSRRVCSQQNPGSPRRPGSQLSLGRLGDATRSRQIELGGESGPHNTISPEVPRSRW